MRLPGRLSAAIEVLEDVEARHRPVSEALKAWGLNSRFAGAGDRAAIGNLVYDALRRRASHAYAMQADTPRALVLSVAVRDWGETPQSLAAAFEQDAHAPAALSAEEASRLAAMHPLADADDDVRADLPAWVLPRLSAGMAGDAVAEGQALAQRPPLDLRVNSLKSTPERVMRSLSRFHPSKAAISPLGLRLAAGNRDARTPNVQADEGYVKGWFEIQDQGSQIVSQLAGAQPGEQVLDLCAGGGGKSLAMAASMGNSGQIFAYDSERVRLMPIYDRLKRAGVRNVQVRPPEPRALDSLLGQMDRVVVDAPCSGAGTWRRRPDSKWKLSPAQVQQRAAEQASILAEARRYLKPGGVLVYITCSILADENEGQIAAFLAGNAGFSPLDVSRIWKSRFGEAGKLPHFASLGAVLTPHRTETDGFFFSMLQLSTTA